MIIESNFEKEFNKHIQFCRDDYYTSMRSSTDDRIRELKDKSNLQVKKAHIIESLYQEEYAKHAQRAKAKIVEKFKECGLSQRLNIINSFYSEFYKIGFSWKDGIYETIIFFVFDQDDHIKYECYKVDYSGFVRNEYNFIGDMNTPFPTWFINSLKNN